MVKEYKFADIEKVMNIMGFDIYKDGRVNIVGIRTMDGEFNDVFLYFKYINNIPIILPGIVGTTDPGKSYLKKVLGNINGTAILVHDNQYIDCWQIGLHKGKYEALVQSAKAGFIVWRDKDMDGQVDYSGKTYNDVLGLNHHTTKLGYKANWIGNFSAGCQVIWDQQSFAEDIMPFCKATGQKYYTYTLLLDTTIDRLLKD